MRKQIFSIERLDGALAHYSNDESYTAQYLNDCAVTLRGDDVLLVVLPAQQVDPRVPVMDVNGLDSALICGRNVLPPS